MSIISNLLKYVPEEKPLPAVAASVNQPKFRDIATARVKAPRSVQNDRTEVVAEPFISSRHVSDMNLNLNQRDIRVRLEICATLRF